MLKHLISALKGGDALNEAFSQFVDMLNHAQWMFSRANDVLRRTAPAEEVREALYQRDQQINDLLRSIRGKIVRHLTISAGSDAPACLALMSIAKDAERIGDYCKNVFEVGQFYKEDFHVERYHEPLERVRQEVDKLFTAVIRSWKDSDPKAARRAIEQAGTIRTQCDDIIEQLLGDTSSMTTDEAVAYSLLARHYKRVAAHLANVSTGVSGKIEDLDFWKKG